MPNVNFTSSSIAQQDRFAQTTVSYESRNMQSIPFYPDVDHKAKFRGIFALTLVCAIVVGALFGLLFGFRDILFRAAASSPIVAWLDGEEAETSSVPAEEVEEDVNFSLAADSEVNPWEYLKEFTNDIPGANGQMFSHVYNGSPYAIPGWNSDDIYDKEGAPEEYKIVFKVSFGSSVKVMNNDSDWPTNVGTYDVSIYAVDKTGKEYKNEFHFENQIKTKEKIYLSNNKYFENVFFEDDIKIYSEYEDGKKILEITYYQEKEIRRKENR